MRSHPGLVLLLLLAGCAGPAAPSAVSATEAAEGERTLHYAPTDLEGVQILAALELEVLAPDAGGEDLPPAPGRSGPFHWQQQVLYLVVDGRPVAFPGGPIEAPAPVSGLTGEGVGPLLAVSGTQLGTLEAKTGFQPAVELPEPGFAVTTDGLGTLFLYPPGRAPGSVYLLEGGRYERLIELPVPILAVAATPGRLFVGIPGGIYQLEPGAEPRIYYAQSSWEPRSLCYAPRLGVLFVSDAEGVMAIVDGVAIPLVEGVSGSLQWRPRGADLLIHSPERRRLLRLEGLKWLSGE